ADWGSGSRVWPACTPFQARNEPAAVPPGFGVRQSSGAFGSGLRAQKRQKTAAVQDALVPARASRRFKAPMRGQKTVAAVLTTGAGTRGISRLIVHWPRVI